MEHKKPIHTTGRTAKRLSESAKQRLNDRLTTWEITEKALKIPPNPLEIELGMGNGLALLERAKAQPDRHFWGSEVYLNGLKTLIHHMNQLDTPPANVCLTAEDGRNLLKKIAKNSIDRLLIPFPDPWPKARHHKRRLLQPELLDDAAKALKENAELWVMTDWPDYAFHAISTLYQHPAFTLALSVQEAKNCKPSARLADKLGPHRLAEVPEWWVPTKYQQKADTAGRIPFFIKALRKS